MKLSSATEAGTYYSVIQCQFVVTPRPLFYYKPTLCSISTELYCGILKRYFACFTDYEILMPARLCVSEISAVQ